MTAPVNNIGNNNISKPNYYQPMMPPNYVNGPRPSYNNSSQLNSTIDSAMTASVPRNI